MRRIEPKTYFASLHAYLQMHICMYATCIGHYQANLCFNASLSQISREQLNTISIVLKMWPTSYIGAFTLAFYSVLLI